MFDMLLESLPDQIDVERLKSSIYYGADPSIYTAARVLELVLAASKRQRGFRGKRYKQDKRGGVHSEKNRLMWTEVPNIKIVFVNQERFERVTYAEVKTSQC